MAAAEGVLISDRAAPLDTARREALGEQLRDRIRRAESGASAAALAAADLAVAIHTTVPNPASTVFWDGGGHAEAYRHLLGLEPSPSAPPAPGRAVSEAVGAAVARTLQHDATSIVAVIDGQGLSAGLAFEAVNHAGHLQLPLVLVLVDAPSTRARSVGAVSRHLTRLRGHPRYAEAKALIEQALSRMPAGGQAVEVARRLKNSMRELLIPTEIWEELLGFTYLGPVDGASADALAESLALALEVRRPVLLHVAAPAGAAVRRPALDADRNGDAVAREAWLRAAAAALADLAEADELCVTVSAGSTARAALHTVAERVPERFLDVELGESHGMSLAASLARHGLRPVVVLAASRTLATIAPLLTDARQSASPLTILAYADAADDAGAQGPPLGAIPGLDVITPTTPDQLRDALAAALAGRCWTLIQLPARATPE
ncbi:MAG: hypothetical protein OXU21_03765 [Chloroflexota bacterium]|nr:hypothetical protein [Chloroflexota bacterium]